MERMLVVVFDNEVKAYEGSRALAELDREGSVSIHAEAVIQKNADGTVSIQNAESDFPVRTLGGTAIGSLVGLLGGPVGVGVGAAVGATVGVVGDLYKAGVNEDFLYSVAPALTPGKFAVLADVSEEWVTPVDARMEALGGVVFRTTREHFEEEQRAKETAAVRADIDDLKAELAQARADRKAKIQARIDGLNKKLQDKLAYAKQRSEQIRSETDAKVRALQQNATKARGDAKAAIDGRIREIQQTYEQSVARMKAAGAEQLRKTAGTLQAHADELEAGRVAKAV
ncbi:MAG TPA: DUF1269 domain-containing protein [Bryobacteraceae bacterium]|nr:DUF1269 domain-containing protein [Bryobacteraceae bacterium]